MAEHAVFTPLLVSAWAHEPCAGAQLLHSHRCDQLNGRDRKPSHLRSSFYSLCQHSTKVSPAHPFPAFLQLKKAGVTCKQTQLLLGQAWFGI